MYFMLLLLLLDIFIFIIYLFDNPVGHVLPTAGFCASTCDQQRTSCI